MKQCLTIVVCFLLLAACAERKPETNQTTAENRAKEAAAVAPASNRAAPSAANANQSDAGAQENAPAAGNLPAGWRWIGGEAGSTPVKYEARGGALRFEVPAERDFYGENRTAPRLMRKVTGDFELETRLNFDPREDYQGAGLLIYRNDNNYLRLERGFGGVGGGENGVRFDLREDEIYEPLATPERFPTTARTVELRISRTGRKLTAFWREPGGDWKEVGSYNSNYPETIEVGLIACNTAAPVTVEFTDFRLAAGGR